MTSVSSRPGRIRGSTPRPGNHVIVMFGATGDLARRKLLPGLFRLAAAGLMPDAYQIIGSSRRDLTGEQFREHARQAISRIRDRQTRRRSLGGIRSAGSPSPAQNPAAPIR